MAEAQRVVAQCSARPRSNDSAARPCRPDRWSARRSLARRPRWLLLQRVPRRRAGHRWPLPLSRNPHRRRARRRRTPRRRHGARPGGGGASWRAVRCGPARSRVVRVRVVRSVRLASLVWRPARPSASAIWVRLQGHRSCVVWPRAYCNAHRGSHRRRLVRGHCHKLDGYDYSWGMAQSKCSEAPRRNNFPVDWVLWCPNANAEYHGEVRP